MSFQSAQFPGFGTSPGAGPPQQPVQSRPLLVSYRTYEEAQRAVDYLSDRKFAVENLGIVGNDLKIAETVLGRLTYSRAAAGGLASGAWFGLFVGVLLGLFAGNGNSWLAVMLAGLLFGAGFGALFGLGAFAATGGRRDFTSRRQIVAGTYDVVCTWGRLDEAKALLADLPVD